MDEVLKEVFLSIKQHKARSILTGFGVAWAMFILIILLGGGNGFRSGVLGLFSSYAKNSIWVTGFWTKQATLNGLPQDVRVTFRYDLIEKIRHKFREIEKFSPEIPINSNYSVKYKENSGKYEVKGIGIDYLDIKAIGVGEGRSFNNSDFQQQRRVMIIGDQVRKMLFLNEDPIGKYLDISGIYFKVIGVLDNKNVFSQFEQNSIYAPNIVIKNIFNPEGEFYTFGILLNKNTTAETFEQKLREYLSGIARFNKDDTQALFINNVQLQVKAFNSLFHGLNVILWVVGLCILLTGIIGVSNIMLVVVKERTQEIGIRKAIGATPASIIVLILSESVLITVFFGIIGLLLGYGGLSLYNWIVAAVQDSAQQVFAKATINAYVIYVSLLIMILSGLFAGLYPAQKAAKIMPIETLNNAN